MRRLLFYFSYMGTYYRGIQRQLPGGKLNIDHLDTVQGIIEHGIKKLLNLKEVSMVLSSRTDAGVHATLNTAHVNLNETLGYTCPENLCQSLNLYLEKNQTEIRVRRVVEIPDNFHCRYNASSRTYRYRIALLKDNDIKNTVNLKRLSSILPIEELNRCHVVHQPFDPKAVFDASRLFLGTWDFQTFCGETPRLEKNTKPADFFVKTLHRFSFSRVSTFNSNGCYHPSHKEFDFYDFYVEGSGFVRRQVRRMIGVLLAVGNGHMTENDIQYMLCNPHENSWNSIVESASAGGLYLKSVNYQNVPVLRGYIA